MYCVGMYVLGVRACCGESIMCRCVRVCLLLVYLMCAHFYVCQVVYICITLVSLLVVVRMQYVGRWT